MIGDVKRYQEYLAVWEVFVESGRAPEYTMDCYQLQGYLCALARGPGESNEADWIPLVFGGEVPQAFADLEQILTCIRGLYRDQVNEQLQSMCRLPFDHRFESDRSARVPAEQWARGFMQGYIYWQNIWSEISDQTQTNQNQAAILHIGVLDEIDDILASISAVADAEYALTLGKTVEELYNFNEELPRTVVNYGRICQDIKSARQHRNGCVLH